MVYNCARLKDAGLTFVKEAAMAKLFCLPGGGARGVAVRRVFGGYGFTRDYPLEKFCRDAKIGKIYEGTSNMQLDTIAKIVLGK